MVSPEAFWNHDRKATDEDLPEIARIHIESWRDAYAGILPSDYLHDQVSTDLHQQWNQQDIQSGDVVLVAEEKGILTGFIAVWCRPNPFIDNLHILPKARSHGIGAELMTEAFQHLISMGHDSACLWVFESNTKAIRFYLRRGAVVSDRQVKRFFGNEVINLRMDWHSLLTNVDP